MFDGLTFSQMLSDIGSWLWIIGGVILLGLKILLPGSFLLWFGISAVFVGIAAILFTIAWQAQVIAFVILALLLVVFARRFFLRRWAGGPPSGLNERAGKLVGSRYVLEQPIADGIGRVRIGDTTWRVSGPDTPSGVRVEVIGVDGTLLKVKPL